MDTPDEKAEKTERAEPEIREMLDATIRQRVERGLYLLAAGFASLTVAWLIWWYTDGLSTVAGIVWVVLATLMYGSLATGVLLLGFAIALTISALRLRDRRS